eukprot:scaffold670_cov333-Pavlova_lutheri.AAC.10
MKRQVRQRPGEELYLFKSGKQPGCGDGWKRFHQLFPELSVITLLHGSHQPFWEVAPPPTRPARNLFHHGRRKGSPFFPVELLQRGKHHSSYVQIQPHADGIGSHQDPVFAVFVVEEVGLLTSRFRGEGSVDHTAFLFGFSLDPLFYFEDVLSGEGHDCIPFLHIGHISLQGSGFHLERGESIVRPFFQFVSHDLDQFPHQRQGGRIPAQVQFFGRQSAQCSGPCPSPGFVCDHLDLVHDRHFHLFAHVSHFDGARDVLCEWHLFPFLSGHEVAVRALLIARVVDFHGQ